MIAVKLFLPFKMKLCQCDLSVCKGLAVLMVRYLICVVIIRAGGYCSGFSRITGFMLVRMHSFHLHLQVVFVAVGVTTFT